MKGYARQNQREPCVPSGMPPPRCSTFWKLSVLCPFWFLWSMGEGQAVMWKCDWTKNVRPNAHNRPKGKIPEACLNGFFLALNVPLGGMGQGHFWSLH